MNEGQTLNPVDFVALMGGFHDARINGIFFDVSKEALTLDFEDLNANYEGLPEYSGAAPGSLIFTGVTNFSIDVDSKEGIRISDTRVFTENSIFKMEIDLSIGGVRNDGRSIVVYFRAMTKISDF